MKSLKKYCEKDNKLELRKLPSDIKQFFLNNTHFSVQKFKNKIRTKTAVFLRVCSDLSFVYFA